MLTRIRDLFTIANLITGTYRYSCESRQAWPFPLAELFETQCSLSTRAHLPALERPGWRLSGQMPRESYLTLDNSSPQRAADTTLPFSCCVPAAKTISLPSRALLLGSGSDGELVAQSSPPKRVRDVCLSQSSFRTSVSDSTPGCTCSAGRRNRYSGCYRRSRW